MEESKSKYEKVLEILRSSKPEIKEVESVTDQVIRQIRQERTGFSLTGYLIEFFFGWVYIGWVRKSMIAVVLVIALIFGYQQTLMMRKLNELSPERIQNGGLMFTGFKEELNNELLRYRFTGRKTGDSNIQVSEKDIDEMIRSLNNLQAKYQDLMKLIEDDPQKKEYLESKLGELKKKR